MKATKPAIIALFLSILWSYTLPLVAQKKPIFFARTIVEKPALIKGDSMLVSIVLYSDADLQQIRCNTLTLKLKNATVRRLNFNRNETLGLRNYKGQAFNSLIWAEYIISANEITTLVLPSFKFEGIARTYIPAQQGSPFLGWWIPQETKDIRIKTATEKVKIPVIYKPQKTTKELLQSKELTL
ncbi:BatD family protein [Alloprevotella rava]|uniref:Uncharacterized protein n=1 Tax=Alloprevotella rava TaxID=671218 RepID=A0A7W5YGH8_9BACT|nr:BatD family protein [Alloprevotella rava]MBB3703136.1 hypothetical protein [Alloprevotella rava]